MTKNFQRSEFACRCGCGFDAIDPVLVERLQTLRDKIGRPILVNSGCRCKAHNKAEKGSQRSFHLLGKAADIRVAGMTAAKLADVADASGLFKGLGRYSSFVHVDVRTARARWTG